jgi:tRNA nucleotidyltransferase (CCA-adding enzyme)
MNETPHLSLPDASGGRWEHFAHQADIGVRGIGPTMGIAFEQAAAAMTAVICDLSEIKPNRQVRIDCAAPDSGLLLVEWLNALVLEMSAERLVFGRFSVRIADGRLHGIAWGEPIDVARHAPAVEVKGATLTELSVAQTEAGDWIAQCVVDV